MIGSSGQVRDGVQRRSELNTKKKCFYFIFGGLLFGCFRFVNKLVISNKDVGKV